MHRRQVLHGVAVGSFVGLAGCTGLLGPNNADWANDLRVENERQRRVSVEITVEEQDGTVHESAEVEIEPQSETTMEDLVEYGSYELRVAVDDGSSAEHGWAAEGPNSMTVVVTSDGIEFVRATA